jgi:hypothetical protein
MRDLPAYLAENELPTTQAALDKAEREGLRVVYPEPNELLLDIDGPEAMATWLQQRTLLDKFFGIKKIVETPSLSNEPGHWHITVSLLTAVSAETRLLLQAVLGSDRKRELLGLVMLHSGEQKPTLFLEAK